MSPRSDKPNKSKHNTQPEKAKRVKKTKNQPALSESTQSHKASSPYILQKFLWQCIQFCFDQNTQFQINYGKKKEIWYKCDACPYLTRKSCALGGHISKLHQEQVKKNPSAFIIIISRSINKHKKKKGQAQSDHPLCSPLDSIFNQSNVQSQKCQLTGASQEENQTVGRYKPMKSKAKDEFFKSENSQQMEAEYEAKQSSNR